MVVRLELEPVLYKNGDGGGCCDGTEPFRCARYELAPETSSRSRGGAKVGGSYGGEAAQQAARTTAQVLQTGQGLKRGSKRFGEAVWGPFVKLSGVLWLELTGVFFGIFALSAAGAAWKVRAGMQDSAANHNAHEHFVWAVVMAVVFGYFCVSSFVSANRRGRRR